MIDIEILHGKWLESKEADAIQAYHPNLLAFESALKAHRKKNNEAVSTTARIVLPVCVETHIHAKFNLAWREKTTRMVYIELRAAMDSYGLLNDQQEFEIV